MNTNPQTPTPLRPIQFERCKYIPHSYKGTNYIPAQQEILILTGVFHQFALEGDGNDIGPVAIIETPDGQIYTPSAHKCKFLDKHENELRKYQTL